MTQSNFSANNSANNANGNNSVKPAFVSTNGRGPGSKSYKRKYGFDLLKEVDPFFLEPGELEAAEAQHNLMAELLGETSVLKDASRKDFVNGEIVGTTDEGYLVNIGRKYDGLVPLAEATGLSKGDAAEFYVTGIKDRNGMVGLSANTAKGWRILENAQEGEEVFQARVFSEAITKRNQKSAGLRIVFEEGTLKGIRGFVPNIEIARGVRSHELVNQLIDVCIVKAEAHKGGEFGNLVASQKSAQGLSDDMLLQSLEVDTIVTGTIVDFIKASPKDSKMSALVRLENGLVAMLHRSETVDSRDSLTDIYKVGEEVSAAIRTIDFDRKRVGLSLKLAAQINSLSALVEGNIVEAEVLRAVPYGYFCSIGGGLEGLLHNSDLAEENGRRESFKTGTRTEVVILSFNEDGSRLALGRKQMF